MPSIDSAARVVAVSTSGELERLIEEADRGPAEPLHAVALLLAVVEQMEALARTKPFWACGEPCVAESWQRLAALQDDCTDRVRRMTLAMMEGSAGDPEEVASLLRVVAEAWTSSLRKEARKQSLLRCFEGDGPGVCD